MFEEQSNNILLVGTKLDLVVDGVKEREVSYSEGLSLAERLNLVQFIEASPLSSPKEDIEDIFIIPSMYCIDHVNPFKLRDRGDFSECQDIYERDSINVVPSIQNVPTAYDGLIHR